MKRLEKLQKKYNQIEDIIVFGSAVKGKDSPKDIDIAVIVKEKDFSLYKELNNELKPYKAHIELVSSASLLKTRLSLNLLMEGYSIDKKDFLNKILGIKPVKLFVYGLAGFSRSKKALFSMALTKTLKEIKGNRIAPGAVIIPISKSGYFNEFLESWEIKYQTSEWTMF